MAVPAIPLFLHTDAAYPPLAIMDNLHTYPDHSGAITPMARYTSPATEPPPAVCLLRYRMWARLSVIHLTLL